MSDSLGLSIGITNLVAARVGAPPVWRSAVLTLYPNRAPEVGVPSENPNLTEAGVVLSGFVERVGDPVPLVAPDGSTHHADRLLVEALDAMVHTVSAGPPTQVAIAVPAHWGPAVLGALRAMLRAKPNLSPNGVPPALVSDAVAALSALRTSPGLPNTGIVALLDFGGSGTSITLADTSRSTGADFRPIDETSRYTEFSGALIDQALLTHVLADINQSSGTDTAGTTAVGALTRLREQCRQAKERLSAETSTNLTAELPGYHSDIRVTRAELENLINEPLTGVLGALEEMLQRNRIPAASLSAVATVGGGAAIPLITQRLSEHLRVPVITTPQPALNTAAGAALLAARGPGADVPTGLAAAASDQAVTGMATAAWAAGAAGAAAMESAADGSASATFRALAWSQDQGGDEPVPYSGADYAYDSDATSARPQMEFLPPEPPPPTAEAPLAWYRRPQVLFAAALLAVLVLTGGLVWTLTSSSSPIRSTRTSTATLPATTNPETPGAPLTQPVTVTGTNGSPTVVTPPPSSTAPAPSTSSSATTSPSTSTSTTTTQTTQTTQTTTTQPTTTTTPPPTTTSTQPPTTTTQAPPTTTVNPPTSSAAFTTPQTITPAAPVGITPQQRAAAPAG
jgi:Hsp70 protein